MIGARAERKARSDPPSGGFDIRCALSGKRRGRAGAGKRSGKCAARAASAGTGRGGKRQGASLPRGMRQDGQKVGEGCLFLDTFPPVPEKRPSRHAQRGWTGARARNRSCRRRLFQARAGRKPRVAYRRGVTDFAVRRALHFGKAQILVTFL